MLVVFELMMQALIKRENVGRKEKGKYRLNNRNHDDIDDKSDGENDRR